MRFRVTVALLSWTLITAASATARAQSTPANDELWEAARAGDAARVTRALERGADVNAKARYGVTALIFAAAQGRTDVVKLLLDKGADIDVVDTFYQARAIDMALTNGHAETGVLLLTRGSKGAVNALNSGITTKNLALVTAALKAPDLTAASLTSSLALAKRGGNAEIIKLVSDKVAALPPAPVAPAVTVSPELLKTYAGTYRAERDGLTVTVTLQNDQLTLTPAGQPALTLVATSQTSFRVAEVDGLTFTFGGRGGLIENVVLTQGAQNIPLQRVVAGAPAQPPAAAPGGNSPPAPSAAPAPLPPATRTAARPWPAFRGDNAGGNGDGQGAVTEWDVATGKNVRWKTPIPGIANSSPIVWGERIFVTTAISSARDETFRTGLYGDVQPVADMSEHTWKIYCLDKNTGKILWEQTAFSGAPKVKRHPKSSQASSTPVTDGRHVVAVFGTVGILAAWDMSGKPLWKKDVGILDSGWFFDPDFQWGHSSSPIVFGRTVIVQADKAKQSFLAAYDLDSGAEVWRTDRDEISTWGTPTILQSTGRAEIVTNGTKIRGYDATSGKLLWTLGPNSEVTVGTPVVGDGMVYVTAGYPPVRPVYAIKAGATGDISLAKDKTSSEAIAWSNSNEGTYIPSPILYGGLLYTLNNNGVLTAYDPKSGERVYRSRIGGGGSYSSSPVAADGKLYVATEDGDLFVIRAGRTYAELAKNEMKEIIMATPAISDGLIVVRTLKAVYGIGEK
jgi:outer membrane protein assembly factor BamB